MSLSRSTASEWDVYEEQLRRKYHGFPLYEPGPNSPHDSVRIGDVGFVSRGRFLRFFNIFADKDDPVNQEGVPDGFEPIESKYQTTYHRDPLSGPIYSGSIQMVQSEIETSADGVRGGIGQTKSSFKFVCKTKRGAALLLRNPAIRSDSRFENYLGRQMRIHYKKWYEFVQQSHPGILLHDIILVTGCDLTREWATATFMEQVSEVSISFNIGATSFASLGGTFWGTWSTETSVPHRFGPTPSTIAEGSSGLITGSSTNVHGSLPLNQCVFIRGWRVKERISLIPAKLKAAAGPSDVQGQGGAEPQGSPSSIDSSPRSDGVDLEDLENDNSYEKGLGTTYDVCFQHLFENSSADVAMIHDCDDIWDNIPSNQQKVDGWHKYPPGPVFPPVLNEDIEDLCYGCTTLYSVATFRKMGPQAKLESNVQPFQLDPLSGPSDVQEQFPAPLSMTGTKIRRDLHCAGCQKRHIRCTYSSGNKDCDHCIALGTSCASPMVQFKERRSTRPDENTPYYGFHISNQTFGI